MSTVGLYRIRKVVGQVLDDLLAWRLSPADWATADELVDGMHRAVAARDWSSLRQLADDVAFLEPMRNNSVRKPPADRTAVSDACRERINQLQHKLAEPVDDSGEGDTDALSSGGS